MKHFKIFKRADGSHVKIKVNSFNERYSFNEETNYEVTIEYKLKGKRLWNGILKKLENDYSFRSLNRDEKLKLINEEILKYVTEDEIYEVKLETHELMKPKRGL